MPRRKISKRQDIRRLNYRMEKISIDDVELHLSAPDDVSMPWVGQEDLVTQVLAAWLVIGEDDLPLSPRLLGKPGVGKTTLAYHAGRCLTRPVYLFQATMDTRPDRYSGYLGAGENQICGKPGGFSHDQRGCCYY